MLVSLVSKVHLKTVWLQCSDTFIGTKHYNNIIWDIKTGAWISYTANQVMIFSDKLLSKCSKSQYCSMWMRGWLWSPLDKNRTVFHVNVDVRGWEDLKKQLSGSLLLWEVGNEMMLKPHFKVLMNPLFFFVSCSQNYLKDPWNVFDLVTVIGSITDILCTEINVRAASVITFTCCHGSLPTCSEHAHAAGASWEGSMLLCRNQI